MRDRDVNVGGLYFTKVGGELVKVRVEGETRRYRVDSRGRMCRRVVYMVRRLDTGRRLNRTARQLLPIAR